MLPKRRSCIFPAPEAQRERRPPNSSGVCDPHGALPKHHKFWRGLAVLRNKCATSAGRLHEGRKSPGARPRSGQSTPIPDHHRSADGLATAFKGGVYEYYGRQYREVFARFHIELEVRETGGSTENIKLLLDPNSDVEIAFVNGGISDGKHAPGLTSHVVSRGTDGAGLFSADRITLVQSSRRFRFRRCINSANAIRPKMDRHNTTSTTRLFVGIGTFSGKRAVGSMGDVLTVARNVLNRDAFVVTDSAVQKLALNFILPAASHAQKCRTRRRSGP